VERGGGAAGDGDAVKVSVVNRLAGPSMSSILAPIARHRHRPLRMTNKGCCVPDSELDRIIQKPPQSLEWADYQIIFTISRCTGTFDECAYFLPFVFEYARREPEATADCIDQLVYFLSAEIDKLKKVEAVDSVEGALRELFRAWTAQFHVVHHGLDHCRRAGWVCDYQDYVQNSSTVSQFIEDMLQYKVWGPLGRGLIEELGTSGGNPHQSAWFIEFARGLWDAGLVGLKRYDDEHISKLCVDFALLKKHIETLEKSGLASNSPTYLQDVKQLLGL